MNLQSAKVVNLQEWQARKLVREAKEFEQKVYAHAQMTLGQLLAALEKLK